MRFAPVLVIIMMLIATGARAQQAAPASLSADKIVFTTGHRVIRASGHVEVVYGTSILTASALTYDEGNNLIIAEGPLRLRDGQTITIIADYAELSADMRRGILKSARMVLNRQLQLTAIEINRSGGRFTQLYKAAASTCTISTAHPTPFWQIRARRIIHDEQKRVLFFERAQLRLGGIPVAYLPRLKVPDPSVKRASGFLVPGLSNSDKFGTGVSIPYFLRLGKYADVTLTPRLYTSGTATLGFDFRKRFHRGEVTLTGALTQDTQSANTLRGYMFADGQWRFRNGLHAEMALQFSSDTTYLSDHGISGTTRLENRLNLRRTKRDNQVNVTVLGFRGLSSSVANDEIPYMLTSATYQRRVTPGILGGQLTLEATASGYTRMSNTDITGRDGTVLRARANWSRQWITQRGLIFSTTAELNGDYYNIRQDSTYAAPVSRAVPIAVADLRLPLVRTAGGVVAVLEPRLQLVYSPGSSVSVPNEDSQIIEFEANNLFALNRFAGRDVYEKGLRVNAGLNYSRTTDRGAVLYATVGKVFRLNDPGQFTAASGLAGSSSGYVIATQITLPSHLRMVHRMVVNNGFSILRNETRMAFETKRFDVDTSYLWLLKGAAGNAASDVSDWSVTSGWNFGRNWRSQATWRYDLLTSAASDAGLALTYRNDCIKVDLSLSRQFASSSNVSTSTQVGLQVTLDGFGGRANSAAYGRSCRDF